MPTRPRFPCSPFAPFGGCPPHNPGCRTARQVAYTSRPRTAPTQTLSRSHSTRRPQRPLTSMLASPPTLAPSTRCNNEADGLNIATTGDANTKAAPPTQQMPTTAATHGNADVTANSGSHDLAARLEFSAGLFPAIHLTTETRAVDSRSSTKLALTLTPFAFIPQRRTHAPNLHFCTASCSHTRHPSWSVVALWSDPTPAPRSLTVAGSPRPRYLPVTLLAFNLTPRTPDAASLYAIHMAASIAATTTCTNVYLRILTTRAAAIANHALVPTATDSARNFLLSLSCSLGGNTHRVPRHSHRRHTQGLARCQNCHGLTNSRLDHPLHLTDAHEDRGHTFRLQRRRMPHGTPHLPHYLSCMAVGCVDSSAAPRARALIHLSSLCRPARPSLVVSGIPRAPSTGPTPRQNRPRHCVC